LPKGTTIYKTLIFALDFPHYGHIYNNKKNTLQNFCATNESESDFKEYHPNTRFLPVSILGLYLPGFVQFCDVKDFAIFSHIDSKKLFEFSLEKDFFFPIFKKKK
jgi:hypothetical protein